MQWDLDGNCFDICFDIYFAVWYVVSDQNRYSSRSPASGVIKVIKQLIILNKNVPRNVEQVLAATPHKTPPTIRPPASHHENYPS